MRKGSLWTVMGVIESGTGLALREKNPTVGWGLAGIGMAKTLYGIASLLKEPHER